MWKFRYLNVRLKPARKFSVRTSCIEFQRGLDDQLLQFVTIVHKYWCTSTFWKISPIHDREMWWVLVCSIARIQPPPLKKETIPVWMFWWNLHHKITCIRKVWVVRGEGGSSRGSGVHGMISPHSSYTSFMTSYVT